MTKPMNDVTPLTWKSIMVLPALIVASAVAVFLVAWSQRLPLHGGLGLLVGVLAVVEIGYLLFLIAASRREGSEARVGTPPER